MNTKVRGIRGFVFLSALVWPCVASAQAVSLPSSVQPGRALQQVIAPLPQAVSSSALSYEEAMPNVPSNAGELRFTLHKVELSGVTVYKPEELKSMFAPYMDKEITLLDVYRVAQAITKRYRDNGYLLAQVVVPAQVIGKGGNIRLRVLEGFISNVDVKAINVQASIPHSNVINDLVRTIEGARPITRAKLERSLYVMNSLPGVHVRAVLMPAAHASGGTDMALLFDRKRIEGYIEADNRGSRYLGPLQMQAGFKVNGLLDADDALGVQAGVAAQRSEMQSAGATYHRVLTPGGLALNLAASKQQTKPGYTLKSFDVKGVDRTLSAGVTYPLTLGRDSSSNIYANAFARDVDSKALDTVLSKDHVRGVTVGYAKNSTDYLLGADMPANDALTVEITQGVNGFGASKSSSVTSRAGARADFTRLAVTASREQYLKRTPWSLYGAATGQYATKKLLTPMQFGVGGASFGSAYDSSEILGDSGFALRGEVRYTAFSPHVLPVASSIQPYAFYDYGQVFDRAHSTGVKSSPSLASAGVGIRTQLGRGFSFSVEAAEPLTRNVAALKDKYPRVFVQVSKSF